MAYGRRFPVMANDSGLDAGRVAVMHKPIAESQPPERWRAELVCSGLVQVFGLGGLRDAVSCTDIVQQKVAVGVDDRIAQELRDFVRAAVDARSGWQSLIR